MSRCGRAASMPLSGGHPLGLNMPVGERGKGLSGGQRQAVALARMLLRDPEVLFLDEPSSSMDSATEERLVKQLTGWAGPNRTIIVCTHRGLFLNLVSRLIVLDGGKVVADGPREQVLAMLNRNKAEAGKPAMKSGEHLEFANDVRAAIESRAPRTAWMQLLAIAIFLTIAGVWAHWATLDEVTSGEGRVIPSSKLQVVQTLDGGIVQEVFVREGDMVDAGQLLLRIDDTDVSAKLGELTQKQLALKAQIARLEAEATGAEQMKEAPEVAKLAPIAFRAEQETFTSRRAKLAQDKSMLVSQQHQRDQELAEYEAQHEKLVHRWRSLSARSMRRASSSSRARCRRSSSCASSGRWWMPRARSRCSQPRSRRRAPRSRKRCAKVAFADSTMSSEAHEDLGKALGDLAIVEESLRSAQNRVMRTSVKAPVRGIVNRLGFTTIGAVVQPGFDLVEIVPIDDTLRIEVEIGPRDVAFIAPGQSARVRLTAYDYQLYGILEGMVEGSAPTLSRTRKSAHSTRCWSRPSRNYIENKASAIRSCPAWWPMSIF